MITEYVDWGDQECNEECWREMYKIVRCGLSDLAPQLDGAVCAGGGDERERVVVPDVEDALAALVAVRGDLADAREQIGRAHV